MLDDTKRSISLDKKEKEGQLWKSVMVAIRKSADYVYYYGYGK